MRTVKDLSLDVVNQRLRVFECQVSVRKKRHTLYLRTSALPPKPGQFKSGQVDLSTGLHETQDGLKQAENLAKKLDEMIRLGLFDWDTYRSILMPTVERRPEIVSELIDRFKSHYFNTQDIQESSWKDGWSITLGHLPQNVVLSPKVLINRVKELPPNSAIRRVSCARLQRLAEFAGIEVNLKQYAGTYSHQDVKRRDLPSDELIAHYRNQITNPGWQWAYGMMATYGVRPHELFFCHFVDHRLKVVEGKTGEREVLIDPFYPDWFDKWDLGNVIMPNVATENRSHIRLGKSVANQFGWIRKRIPGFPEAYQLRHCYAIRLSSIFHVPVPVAAKLMGHSPDVHLRTYSRWLNESHKDKVISSILSRTDLPQAPL